jgi:hypothetical protein
MKYRKKPVVIEAIQWVPGIMTHLDLPEWFKNALASGRIFGKNQQNFCKTLEGNMEIRNGDWIIQGVKGEIYPCKPDIFEMTYEPSPSESKCKTIEEIVCEYLQDEDEVDGNKSIRDIVEEYMELNEMQHLFSGPDGENCSCGIEDLMPCGAAMPDLCMTRYSSICKRGDECSPECEGEDGKMDCMTEDEDIHKRDEESLKASEVKA